MSKKEAKKPMNLNNIKNHEPTVLGMEHFKKYAICIPLLKRGDSYEILFEVRSSKIVHQPGDICFPGGQMEEDELPEEAAVRETMEELLIEKEQIEILNLMDVYVNGESRIIYPFAGILKDYQGTWSEDEVEETFLVPLDFFLNTEPEIFYTTVESIPEDDFPYQRIHGGKKYPWRKSRNAIYFYSYHGYEIWGLTAKIMKSFIDIWRK